MKHARWLLILLLTLLLGATGAMAQGIDADNDGVPFRRDNCPNQPGPPENNGCPFVLGEAIFIPPSDIDGDGLPDSSDNCPTVAGVPENNGCPGVIDPNIPPAVDTDADGTNDPDDQCPTVAGPRENRGCPPASDPPPAAPPTDSDGDGLADPDDQCPTVAGIRENGGCPPTNPPPGVPDSSVPPFTPPVLPTDGCYVTPLNGNQVNVRKQPNLGADILGYLLSGKIYSASGFVMNGPDRWYVLTAYENSTGETGYTSASVALGSNCAEIVPPTISTPPQTADQFATNPLPPQPVLCYLTVGYDAAFYGSAFDPALGDDSIPYAAFYFEQAAGTPIQPGTPVWGVDFINGYNALPPDSPLAFLDPDNAVAAASDMAVVSQAIAGGVSAAFPLAFPNPNGGVMAPNGTMFYRLSSPEHHGNCGPIVGGAPGGLTVADADPGVQALQCFVKPGTTIVSDCWCETSDTACVNLLTAICWGGGAYIDAGPDNTACWYDPLVDSGLQIDMLRTVAGSREIELPLECAMLQGRTTVETCWCPTNDGLCIDRLVATCTSQGGTVEQGTDITSCDYDGLDATKRIDEMTVAVAAGHLDACDDLMVWWFEAPNPYGDPFQLQDMGGGYCNDPFSVFERPATPGMARLIAGRGDSQITDPTENPDCDFNGVPDHQQSPLPPCALDLTSQLPDDSASKETEGWWSEVLRLTCGGSDWIIMLEIDEDGDEVVTDAQCVDDMD